MRVEAVEILHPAGGSMKYDSDQDQVDRLLYYKDKGVEVVYNSGETILFPGHRVHGVVPERPDRE